MTRTSEIEEKLGYHFRDPGLLEISLTHPSALAEGLSEESNQRLEFLGDAVLELAVSEKLYSENPGAPEGPMTTSRASLVRGPSLAELARTIQLQDFLILGPIARQNSTHLNQAALEDALEALFGAIYLDGGLEATRSVLNKLFEARSFDVDTFKNVEENPKGALQESLQSSSPEELPEYAIEKIEGPPHDRTFEASVRIGDAIVGRGTGTSKKAAETEAARQALEYIRNSTTG
tara:strand:+ start:11606 stop:12307 length:702 start_codon:yes stop_codon:yes gene_type:complete